METAAPVRVLSSRHVREDATVARRGIRRAQLALAQRTAPRSESDPSELTGAAPRHRIVLAWRVPMAEGTLSGPVSGSWRSSAPPATGAPGPGVAPAAVDRAATRMLEPAVAERLVEDVIRRVDRRMRIERERRGL
jgi:hypothetical protein